MTDDTADPTLAPGRGPSARGAHRGLPLAAVRDVGLRFAMVWCLIALTILAVILYHGFFQSGNIRNILSQNAPVGLVAVGITFAIIAGVFDLSVAAILSVCGVAFAVLADDVPIAVAGVLVIGLGAIGGLINGIVVAQLKVNSFIATLATSSLYLGGAALYTNNAPINVNNKHFAFLGSSSWLGINVSIYVVAAALIVGGFVLAKTTYGRSIYAVGGNSEAARLAGIRVNAVRTSTFVISGICAGIAGLIVASINGVGQPSVETDITLNAISIVIIGGTSLFGGEGAMWRTFVGLLIFGVINNLFDSLAWPTATQQIVLGAILIIAVSVDAYMRSRART